MIVVHFGELETITVILYYLQILSTKWKAALRKALNGLPFNGYPRVPDRQQAGMGSIGVVDPYGSQHVVFFAPPQSGTLLLIAHMVALRGQDSVHVQSRLGNVSPALRSCINHHERESQWKHVDAKCLSFGNYDGAPIIVYLGQTMLPRVTLVPN